MKKSIIKLWPFIIFTAALAARFIFLAGFEKSPFFYPEVGGLDPSLYHNWAKELSQGYWPGDALLYGHPLYPYIMSLIYKIFGPDIYPVIVFQFLLGSLSCVLIYSIARRLFSAGAGIISSLVAALYGPFLFYEALLVPSALSIFLNLAATLFLLNILDAPKLYRTFLGGLLLGYSLTANAGIIPFGLLLIFWIAWNLKKHNKRLFAHLACVLLGMLLPVCFFSLKHFAVEGKFGIFAAHGGINFYGGNNPKANGCFSRPLEFTPTAGGLSRDSSKYAQRVLGKNLTTIEINEFWYKKAFEYIKNHPFLWIKLLLRKFVLFWNKVELGDVVDYYISKGYSVLLKYNPFVFGAVAPFGLLGMFLALREIRKAFLIYAGVCGYMLACVLFFVNSRYRLPALPYLIIFAGLAGYRIWFSLFGRGFKRRAVYAASLILFFIFSNRDVLAVDVFTPRFNLSVIYAEKGLYDEAIKISEGLLKQKNSNMYYVHFNLGVCYYQKGMIDSAALEFQKALALNPGHKDSHFNMGIIYCQKRENKKALEELGLSFTGTETDGRIHYQIAKICEEDGDLSRAKEEYEAAVKLLPDSPEALKALKGLVGKAKASRNLLSE